MSNSLSVASVTASIAELLRFAVAEPNGGTVPGAIVTHLAPGDPALDGGSPGVNLYLFSAGIEAASRNEDLPTRGPGGERVAIPKLPLCLSYLVTFQGDQSRLEPQRLMGSVAVALHAQPVLGKALIEHTIRNTPWLAGCDLASAPAVSVILAPFSDPEQMGRFWMNFAGVPHRLALLYTASVVTLDADVPVVPAPPVQSLDLALGAARPERVPPPLTARFESRGGTVTASVSPQAAPGSPATLCLNSTEPPHALLHRVEAVAHSPDAGIGFDVSEVPPGNYLALVIVQGAWSERAPIAIGGRAR